MTKSVFMKYRLEIIFVVFIVAFAALFLYAQAAQSQAHWEGSDDQGSAAIEATGYTPWIQPLWTPPSSEVESLLFSIQSGLGAFVIGYFFGFYRGKRDAPAPA